MAMILRRARARYALIGVLAGAFTLAVMLADASPVAAQESTVNVEVRVWQSVRDARSIHVSARPEGGDWDALGTISLPLDDGYSSSGSYRYGDITVAGVEVRVWQSVRNARSIQISARPEGGDWGTLGTIPLPLDDGYSSSGSYRYGDITVAVPLSADSPSSASCTTEQRFAAWDVEWFALDSDGYRGGSLGRRQWVPTFSADWGWGQVFGGRENRLMLDATMSIVAPHAGWFWFEVGGDDGFRLYIDEDPVLVDWKNGSARTWGRFQWLQRGVHEMRLEYYEWGGRAELLFDTDQTLLSWSEAKGCDAGDRPRLIAESPAPILFDGDVLPSAAPGSIVVFLQGIDSHSSCEDAGAGWRFLEAPQRLYEGSLRADTLGPEDNTFRRRQSIVDYIQGVIPKWWESSVIGFSYSGQYEDCPAEKRFSGQNYQFGNHVAVPSYAPISTCIGVQAAAERLGVLLNSLHAQEGNRDIVLVGHSLGGMTSAYYVATLAPPELLERIKSIITVDSPLLGDPRRKPFSSCHSDTQSWSDIRGDSSVVGTIQSISRSSVVEKFIHLNSSGIGDSISGGRTVTLECAGLFGLLTGSHGCGFYDPVALQEIVDAVQR